MAGNEWSTTARTLAEQYSDDDDEYILPVSNEARTSISPVWSRRSLDASGRGSSSNSSAKRPRTVRQQWMQNASRWYRQGVRQFNRLSTVQKVWLVATAIITNILLILFLIYSERIFVALRPAAKKWRNLPAGWLILWAMTVLVSFPPMIGYSSCVTIAGFVFGMKGWFIVASGTVIGSTLSFLVSRTVLKSFVSRMTEKNTKFAALSLVLKHDGLTLLCMIRLCPLPYSFANGAISTIPTVSWPNFMLATAIVSPKLLLHVFVGSQMANIGDNAGEMDTKTKVISYLTAFLGIVFGAVTGYVIYARTKARAKSLEAEEVAAAVTGRRTSDAGADFIEDPDEQEAVDYLRSRESDISLHRAYEDRSDLGRAYRDEFTDDEINDAQERDVFDEGDGDTDAEAVIKKKDDR